MRASTKAHYTYEDYLSSPEDSSRRYEIVAGELFVTAAPQPPHQRVLTRLTVILDALVSESGLGEVIVGGITVLLADDTVLEPDLIFVSDERRDIVDSVRGAVGPPNLVVEVLSPSNRSYDRNLKRRRYLEFGVPELWIVDTDARTIEVWRPGSATPEVARDTLTWRVGGRSFEIALADVFRAFGAKGR